MGGKLRKWGEKGVGVGEERIRREGRKGGVKDTGSY